MFYLYDPTFILIIPAIILTLYAQIKVQRTFNKYAQKSNHKGLTGKAMAEKMLNAFGITNVPVNKSHGYLSDHYNPLKKELSLSEEVYNSSSLSAVGVAAHEAGHAIQHARGYFPLHLRTLMYPAVNVGTFLAPILILAGFIIQSLNLLQIGIVFYALSVIFTLITLPVEFDASSRAMSYLRTHGILTTEELQGTKKVLSAAALTYVAAAVTALLELIRLILIARGRE